MVETAPFKCKGVGFNPYGDVHLVFSHCLLGKPVALASLECGNVTCRMRNQPV